MGDLKYDIGGLAAIYLAVASLSVEISENVISMISYRIRLITDVQFPVRWLRITSWVVLNQFYETENSIFYCQRQPSEETQLLQVYILSSPSLSVRITHFD